MGHYRSNLRDVEFNLFELYRLGDVLGTGPFSQMDTETARGALSEIERLASGPFADSFVEGDRTPLALDDEGNVTIPDGLKRSLDAYFGGDWYRMDLPQHLGGFGAPPSLSWAASGMLTGANAAALMYCAGPFFASIADELVTDEQRERWIKPWVDKEWGGTMVLTEPDAGSDVGAARTKAIDNGDGTWSITGTKRFITNGDFDWPDNIVHLVLARPEGAGAGTKGLSLFIVPKYWYDEAGNLGERNPAVVTGIEDKMGLKASSTCEITFDGAHGVLVGEAHDGIRQMFKVIEYARMLVGTKAIETLSTGYLNALEYAKERVQGADLLDGRDPEAPRVEIIRHPDVRRSLMAQKAHVEGMRALMFFAASLQDRIELADYRGETDTESYDELVKLNDLVLPLVKGYGSEKSYELLAQSLQIFGGSGYCRDYPLEQYIRDAKIDTLYEGTTAIQALDLFFRKIGKDQGATLGKLLAQITETAKGDAGNGQLATEREHLATAIDEVEGMLSSMVEFLGHDSGKGVYLIGLNTTPFLYTFAELVVGWLLIRQAELAVAALADEPSERDQAFYEGKIASARWFAQTVLPEFGARRAVLAGTDFSLMELSDEAF